MDELHEVTCAVDGCYAHFADPSREEAHRQFDAHWLSGAHYARVRERHRAEALERLGIRNDVGAMTDGGVGSHRRP